MNIDRRGGVGWVMGTSEKKNLDHFGLYGVVVEYGYLGFWFGC